MNAVTDYEVWFRRPSFCVVYTSVAEPREVSLLARPRDGEPWHCALCDSTECRHTQAVVAVESSHEESR